MIVIRNGFTNVLKYIEKLWKGFHSQQTLCWCRELILMIGFLLIESNWGENVPMVKQDLIIAMYVNRFVYTLSEFNNIYKRNMRHKLHMPHVGRIRSKREKQIWGFQKVGDMSQAHFNKIKIEEQVKEYYLTEFASVWE